MSGVTSKHQSEHRIPAIQYSRRTLLQQLSRHRWKALLSFLAVFSIALLYAIFAPKKYESESIFYVRLGRENVRLDPTTTMGQSPVMAVPDSRESEINSVVEILRSRAIAEKVIDTLGPELILDDAADSAAADENSLVSTIKGTLSSGASKVKGLLVQSGLSTKISTREQAITKLQKSFSTNAYPKSHLLSLSYRSTDPAVAQQIVTQYSDIYLNEHSGLNRTPDAHSFMAQQTDRMKQELTKSENALKNLQQETTLASPDSQRELLVARVNRLQDDLLATDTLAQATKSEVEALSEKMAALSETTVSAYTTGLNNNAADGMRQTLFSLQLQEKKLAEQYTEDHQELKNIRRQIAQSQAIVNQQEESRSTEMVGPNQTYEELRLASLKQEAALKSLEAKALKLRSQLEAQMAQLQTHIDDELKIATLQREVQLKDLSYRKYAENLEQSHIDHALESERISNINVVQPATYVERPVSPKLAFVLLAGLVCGLAVSSGVVVLCDSLDHSLKTPEEVEQKLSLPVLASIPPLKQQELVPAGGNGS